MNIISSFVLKNWSKYLKSCIKVESKYLNFSYRNYYSSKSQIFVEAEKVIRMPLSHFHLKQLLRDELDITIFTMNKVNTKYISESNHPIVEITKNIFDVNESETNIKTSQYYNSKTGSLLLLLLAKVCESLPSFKFDETIIKRQCDFVEIYEIINKALFIHHEAVLNLPTGEEAIRHEVKRLNDANKISILGGDYLLSYAIVRLSHLIHNTVILQMIMCAIDDYCIHQFNGIRDLNGNLIPSTSMSILDWEEMSGYSLTRLMSYCCQIILILAKQSDRYQKAAFDLGYNLQLIWNMKQELESFSDPNEKSSLNLTSAPIIFHLEFDPKFLDYLKLCETQNLDYVKIRQMIISGPAIDRCYKHLELYKEKALKSLNIFPESAAKEILKSTTIFNL